MIEIIKAVIMGVVEGLTEFLPISSTGHLILAGEVLQFTGEKAKTFEVFIQLGAILAVVWAYRQTFARLFRDLPRDPRAQRFSFGIFVAFLPAAIVGLGAHKLVKAYLFSPVTVAAALVVGGLAILAIEHAKHANRIDAMEDVTLRVALAVGIAQIFALFPGVSRSGATIMGGLLAGMSRKASTEFSFFLAVPTMLAATVFDLAKGIDAFAPSDILVLAVGFVTSFFSALVVVHWLLKFVSHHDFKPFAWYRIIFGGILLWFFLK